MNCWGEVEHRLCKLILSTAVQPERTLSQATSLIEYLFKNQTLNNEFHYRYEEYLKIFFEASMMIPVSPNISHCQTLLWIGSEKGKREELWNKAIESSCSLHGSYSLLLSKGAIGILTAKYSWEKLPKLITEFVTVETHVYSGSDIGVLSKIHFRGTKFGEKILREYSDAHYLKKEEKVPLQDIIIKYVIRPGLDYIIRKNNEPYIPLHQRVLSSKLPITTFIEKAQEHKDYEFLRRIAKEMASAVLLTDQTTEVTKAYELIHRMFEHIHPDKRIDEHIEKVRQDFEFQYCCVLNIPDKEMRDIKRT